jgi:hypothetical protein
MQTRDALRASVRHTTVVPAILPPHGGAPDRRHTFGGAAAASPTAQTPRLLRVKVSINPAWRGRDATIASARRSVHVLSRCGGIVMRARLLTVAIVSLLGVATPAFADSGSGASLERALLAARDFGVIGFSEIQYYDGKWEIEGRDPRGKAVNIDVDALSGAVVKADRFD